MDHTIFKYNWFVFIINYRCNLLWHSKYNLKYFYRNGLKRTVYQFSILTNHKINNINNEPQYIYMDNTIVNVLMII